MNYNKENKSSTVVSDSDEFKEYKRKTAILRFIQRPCLWLASFCLSFLFFNFIVFRIHFPIVLSIILLVFGVIALIAVIVTGYFEKKLYRKFMFTLSAKIQKAVKETETD